jgi:hypothetical protein
MTPSDRKNKIALVWFLYSIIIASAAAYAVLRYIRLPGPEASVVIGGLYATLWGLAVTGSFLMVFHYGVSRPEAALFTNPRYNLPILFMSQGIAYGAYLKHMMTLEVFFMTTIILQTISTFFTYQMALKGFKITEVLAKKTAQYASLSILLLAVVGWRLTNFWSLEAVTIGSSLLYSAINSFGLLGVALAYSLHPSLRIDHNSVWNSYLLRVDSNPERPGKIFNMTLMAGFLQLMCLIYLLSTHSSFTASDFYLGAITFQFIFAPAVIDAWIEISFLGHNLNNLLDVSRLTSNSARKFLMRHNQKRDHWSAAVGVKTAFLHIEHDVERILQNNLPATFLRIRSEEMSRIVEILMCDRSILTHSNPEQVTCAVDPEHSIRPCLDALKLCATLYLDAGAILQRRLQGLVALLPIINPGLAAALDAEVAASLLRKTKWFFYFDHLWVDQRILNTPTSSQYGIQYDQLSPEIRMNLINHMNGLHGLGNFIWLSQQAKERITQELPALSNIFTTHEVPTKAGHTHLMFSLKFEELIPRLQRYYALDQFRQQLFDFEPSPDSQKLLNILSLQINNANRVADFQRIIDVIAGFKWKGFREKDLALRLLLSINERMDKLTETRIASPESRQDIFAKLGASIAVIGYPSQVLNQAHVYKIENRNLEKIKRATLDARHVSHLEAWATLASIDFKKLTEQEFLIARSIIKSVAKRVDLMVSPTIQARMLDCAANLIKTQSQSGRSIEFDLLLEPINTIIRLNGDFETASLIIDVLNYINKITQKPVELPRNITDYFDSLSAKPPGKNGYWQQSVASSWQEYKTSRERTTQQSKQAS